jgi:hypothetical protein
MCYDRFSLSTLHGAYGDNTNERFDKLDEQMTAHFVELSKIVTVALEDTKSSGSAFDVVSCFYVI